MTPPAAHIWLFESLVESKYGAAASPVVTYGTGFAPRMPEVSSLRQVRVLQVGRVEDAVLEHLVASRRR